VIRMLKRYLLASAALLVLFLVGGPPAVLVGMSVFAGYVFGRERWAVR
jgi:hypothetical protein